MKRIIIVVSIFILLFGFYTISNNKDFINKVVYELVDDYKKLSLDSEGDTILTDEVIVQLKLDVEDFNEITDIDITNQDAYREAAKEYYSSLNNEYLSSINLNNFKSVYISKYSPYIEYTYQRDKYFSYKNAISYTINNHDKIETAYVKDNIIDEVGQMRDSMYVAGAYDQYTNNEYTGAGIKVGVLEPGLVDGSLSCFYEGQVTTLIQDEPLEAIQEHTSHMAAYIAGNEGVAPDAKIYSAYVWGTLSAEMDWFIQQGVNIINMSYGDANPTGQYASDSAYCDYIVNTYKITLVGAVGNTGNDSGLVSNPALGYNVIGVGSCFENGMPEFYSSYVEYSGGPKPTIMAAGSGVVLFDLVALNTGTSVSCALVTGLIALLMEQFHYLKTSPDQVMSTMICSSYQDDGYTPMANGLDNYGGAGMFRYDSFQDTYYNYSYLLNLNGRTGTFIHAEEVTLTEGTMFKTSLAWLAYANGTVSSTKYTNYDLYMYNSEGGLVAASLALDSNIELITFEVPADGIYTIKIKQIGAVRNRNETLFLVTGEMPEFTGFRGEIM